MNEKTQQTTTPASLPSATATLRYIDRPELTETFADSITGLNFDGQTLRIEFSVTRLDGGKPVREARRYPTARLVMNSSGAADLINRMQQIAAAMVQAGMLKASDTQPSAGKTGAATERTPKPAPAKK